MNNGNGDTSEHQRWIIAVIILLGIIIIIGAAVFSMSVTPDEPGIVGAGYPYTVTFNLSFPEGKAVRVGDMEILALQTGDRMALKIGERREEMKLGEGRTVADRTASLRILGHPVFQTGYRLDATWTGILQQKVQFRITLHTSRQVPDWLISRILPAQMTASPA